MKASTKYLKIFCNLLTAFVILFLIAFVMPRAILYFMPFVVGFLLSLIANPVVKFLEKRIKIKRKYGSVIMIVLVIGAIVLVCYWLIVLLIMGLKNFAEYVPTLYENASHELTTAIRQIQSILDHLPFKSSIDLTELGTAIGELIGESLLGSHDSSVSAISDFAKSIPDILVGVIAGLLSTYFFTTDRDKLFGLAKKHLPFLFHEKTIKIYNQLATVVGGYFKAQFKIMGVIYVILTIGLMIIGVKYAWLVGFGIAFLDMLPVFGTGTVLCPWAAIKLFSGSYQTAIGMLILYAVTLVVHQLVQPKLVGETVGMDPFATLFFMYIGYQVSSVIGMIIAIPVGMILLNLGKAGAFDNLVWCFKEILHDFNEFRKIKNN